MLTLARNNAAQADVANARFLYGHIEDIPLPDGHVDVVFSNCVINLSTDKATVLAEAFRVLRPGGRLGISDVIADEDLGARQRAQAEQRVGCVSGTLTRRQYQDLLAATGFTAITITATTGAGEGVYSAIIKAGKP
jgi:ubiquinone/menaquinone biosynthesis C-methylase UbiE